MDRRSGEALRRVLFDPRSVALVGASDDVTKAGARPLTYLRRAGWTGEVYPVNPRRRTVLGERAWPSLDALPAVPDHVFVVGGAGVAVQAVRDCAAAGVPLVTVLSDGFLPGDPGGPARGDAVMAAVRSSSTRLMGPSSLGAVNAHTGLVLTANAAFAEPGLPAGGVLVASQSGSAIGALASRGKAAGIGFSCLVSTGNELDLTLGEICLATVDDPRVTGYALFLESLPAVEQLSAFALAAAERGKPVLAYKLGRSAAAAELSVSHTGALAGDDAVADAVLRDLGIGRVSLFETLLEGQALAAAVPIPGAGSARPRVAVVTTTGGGGAMVVDCLAGRGADVRAPGPETAGRLRDAGIPVGHGVLLDLTLAGARYEVMKGALDILLDSADFDAVVAVPGSSARFHPQFAVEPIIHSGQSRTPLAAFIMPDAPDALRLLRTAQIAAFRTPEACADAVVTAFSRRPPRSVPAPARLVAGEILDEADSYCVLDRLGVPVADHAVLIVDRLPDELPIRGPAAVKVLDGAVPHKSDVGGVLLDVGDADGLRVAVDRISRSVAEATGREVARVIVQSMVRGLAEVLIGYRVDSSGVPVVVLAAGGVTAELYGDRAVRPAPVDLATAREMIDEVVALRALTGYRNREPGDLDALAKAVVALSCAGEVDDPLVLDVEANPVVVLPAGRGVVAVDALVRTGRPRVHP